jgi:hypothetical protein
LTWLDSLTLDTVIVHTQGDSFKGVKAAVHDDCLVLRDVFVLEPEGQGQTQLNGEIVIPREQVLYMQIVGA